MINLRPIFRPTDAVADELVRYTLMTPFLLPSFPRSRAVVVSAKSKAKKEEATYNDIKVSEERKGNRVTVTVEVPPEARFFSLFPLVLFLLFPSPAHFVPNTLCQVPTAFFILLPYPNMHTHP